VPDRLVVLRERTQYYVSALTPDPIWVPEHVFSPGAYEWQVEAVADGGQVGAVSQRRSFAIAENSQAQPWVDPAVLLAKIPAQHPRIFFLASQLDQVRETLYTTRAEAFIELKRMAEAALAVEAIPEPDYDCIVDSAQRRLAYGCSTRLSALNCRQTGAPLCRVDEGQAWPASSMPRAACISARRMRGRSRRTRATRP
jgi:hypothetical protein